MALLELRGGRIFGRGRPRPVPETERSTMQYDFIDCEIRDGTATLTLTGAVSPPLSTFCDEFTDLYLRLQEDRAVRVILMTDGEQGFDLCSDLEDIAQRRCNGEDFDSLAPDLDIARRLVTLVQEISKPVIAAARGLVSEGGLGLFLAADVKLASESATFRPADVGRGLIPDWGLTHSLPRLIGPSRALELLWSGRVLDAREAHRIGLVDRVLAGDVWEEELDAFATRIGTIPQPAVRLTKLAVQQAMQFDMTSMLSYEYEAQQQCWESQETSTGMAAFLTGQAPDFTLPALEDEE
jgi:enoyl-CoA hydratase/carnithine racemase